MNPYLFALVVFSPLIMCLVAIVLNEIFEDDLNY